MILALIGMLLGLVYSGWRVAYLFPIGAGLRWLIGLLWVGGFIGLTLLVFGRRDSLTVEQLRIVYPLLTSWMIYLLYVVMLLVVLDLLRLIPALRPSLAPSWTLLSIVWLIIISIFTYGSIRYQRKVRVPLDIKVSKKLPRPLKIVAISDLHLGYTIGKNELEQWVQLINTESPDLILMAGDIIDGDPRPVIEDNLMATLAKLKAPVYACLGNHEYIGGEAQQRAFLRRTNIHLLKDSVALFENSVYIIGRDDASNRQRKPLSALTKGLDHNRPIILLDHQPHRLDEAERNKVDLQFSGHTHDGQVFPINLIVNRLYEKAHGYHQRGKTQYYISSGIGIWGGKYRIGTVSEYVVINLRAPSGSGFPK